jgi:hypothetical protein
LTILCFETNFQEFEEKCVFNIDFEEGLEDLVHRSFDLDELGLKDNKNIRLRFCQKP